jgi:regulator of protease activity HflC (stomatin/prohibitin superfamily)
VLDLRIDQTYLRSQPVNSEEGAPMGIGVWYEMYISNQTDYLFKNQDPDGSLRANVSNATIRELSNMKLSKLLEDRHELSRSVREEVSETSHEWGFKVGSVYIRKVHFRDGGMIRQIEEKVTNRLRQVTSAIKQDGANQVSVITSGAERTAAVEFARAAAIRPEIVGNALREIGKDKQIASAMFDVLEVQRILDSPARITLLPPGATQNLLVSQLAARPQP